jgi:hypothetical protein
MFGNCSNKSKFDSGEIGDLIWVMLATIQSSAVAGVAQDRDKWKALVNTIKNLQVP